MGRYYVRPHVPSDVFCWASKMKRAKRSTVWDHFDRKADEVTCKICYAILKKTPAVQVWCNITCEANIHKHCAMKDNKHCPQYYQGEDVITQRICSMIVKDIMPICWAILSLITISYEDLLWIEECFQERKKITWNITQLHKVCGRYDWLLDGTYNWKLYNNNLPLHR